MKKLALALALTFAAPAFADQAMIPSHAVSSMAQAMADNFVIAIDALAWSAATTTWVNNRRTAVITADSGTETMVATTTVGLDLIGVEAVVVRLKTSAAATAGGKLQAYLYNPDDTAWARWEDGDLTVVAATNQTWDAKYVPVQRGRLYYNPSGVGSVTTTIYLVGQPKN